MESDTDKLSRLQGMASGDDTWDLSDHDTEAIAWILKREQRLREALKAVYILTYPRGAVDQHVHETMPITEAQRVIREALQEVK